MPTRCILILAAAFLIVMSPARLVAVDSLTGDEAREAASDLADAVGKDYDCDIVVTSIKAGPPSDQGLRHFFVSFKASGSRCDQAQTALNDRGKTRGLVFLKKAPPREKDDPLDEPILDLIHEIDPPVE